MGGLLERENGCDRGAACEERGTSNLWDVCEWAFGCLRGTEIVVGFEIVWGDCRDGGGREGILSVLQICVFMSWWVGFLAQLAGVEVQHLSTWRIPLERCLRSSVGLEGGWCTFSGNGGGVWWGFDLRSELWMVVTVIECRWDLHLGSVLLIALYGNGGR